MTPARICGAFGTLTMFALVSACGGAPEIATAAQALECAQYALGGRNPLLRASSLAVVTASMPTETEPTGRPGMSEFLLQPPDTYKRATENRQADGRRAMAFMTGIGPDGPIWASPFGELRGGISSERVDGMRREFARTMFMWLLRETPVVPLRLSLGASPEDSSLHLVAEGPYDFNITMVIDRESCLPRAATYLREPNLGDGMRESQSTQDDSRAVRADGKVLQRYDFEEYRIVDGIRFPWRFTTSRDGQPTAFVQVREVRINLDTAKWPLVIETGRSK